MDADIAALYKSSPRTWGCFYHFGAIYFGHVSLPHARGGVSKDWTPRYALSESSPRTWGCFRVDDKLDRVADVFPTHVGVFLYLERMGNGGQSLPHARGGVSSWREVKKDK